MFPEITLHMKILKKISILITMFLLFGCSVHKKICPCQAPAVLKLGKKEISIKAKLSESDSLGSTGMKIGILLSTLDQSSFPSGISADYYYLRSSNLEREAFTGHFSKINLDYANGSLELGAFNDLKWGKDELIDVAVHLVQKHGKKLFIKREAVQIQSNGH